MASKFYLQRILFFTIFFCLSVASYGQEHENEHHDSEAVHTGSHISAFVGVTVDYHDNFGYKLGLEYEYRLNRRWGLASSIDFVGADFEIIALSAGGVLYPFNNIPFAAALAVGGKYKNEEWHGYVRGLLAYDFHLGKVSLSPTIIHDFFPESKDITSFGLQVGVSL